MRAATIIDGTIEVRDHADPEPGTGDLLVRVRAAGINGADLIQRAGFYPAPPGSPADIPGLELAGEVVAVGRETSRFAVGDRVMAIVGGGAQAELAVINERVAMAVPDGLGWPEAGGFPEAFVTAHDALFTQAGLTAGERVLVHGAAGGVGTAAVQLASRAGASVVATVRHEDLRAQVAALTADVKAVAPDGFSAHGPFDVVLELVGAPNLDEDLTSLATGGRIAIIGVGAGFRSEINLLELMQRRGRMMGSTLRARPLEEKAQASREVERTVVAALGAGRLTVPVHETFPLNRVAEAYDRFAAGGKLGKLVLLP